MGIGSILGRGAAGAAGKTAASAGTGAAGKSIASSVAKNIAPALGKAASGAGASAAGGAAKGVVWGAGAAVGEGVVNLLKQESFVLFIVGLLHFFWLRNLGNTIHLYSSIALLIFATYVFLAYMAEKGSVANKLGGWIVLLFFLIWYLYNGATLDGLIYFGIIFGAILLVVTIATKGRGFQSALAALFPILFFFMDLGVLSLVFKEVDWQLAKIFSDLILYMPWWSLLALFCFPTEDKSKLSSFMGPVRILAVVYIVIILGGSLIPSVGHDTLIPSAGSLMTAQQQVQEKFQGENPFISNMICIFEGRSDISECVKERQQTAEDTSYCKSVEKLDENTPQFEQCLKDRQEYRQKQQVQVVGSSDPTIKQPTRAELITDKFFPREVNIYPEDNYQVQYPIQVKIINPREQIFMVEVNCNFTKQGSSKPESFSGIVTGGDKLSFPGAGENQFAAGYVTQSRTLYCNYPDNQILNGSYKITFIANLSNVNTVSRLSRVFIGFKDATWRNNWITNNKILDTHFSNRNYASVSPEDFVRLNFAFGHSSDYPIIEANRSIVLNSMIENIGPGEITAVHDYAIKLSGFNIQESPSATSNMNCLEGRDVPMPKGARKDIYLPGCLISSLPLDLTNPEMYIYREFEAEVNYDYLIKKEESIRVSRLS